VTQQATCQQRMFAGAPCGLPVDSSHSTLCILHDPNETKDTGLFDEVLRGKIKQDEADPALEMIDLSNVVFHCVPKFDSRVFKKVAYFHEAMFTKGASFCGARFVSEAHFWGARFRGKADFTLARFEGTARFSSAQFDVVDFNDARFDNVGRFTLTSFEGETNFWGTVFSDHVRFGQVDMSRVQLLGTDVSKVHFVGCTWPKKPDPLLWPFPIKWPKFLVSSRNAVHDEILLVQNLEPEDAYAYKQRFYDVSGLYRQLRLNLEASRQEIEAGDFYIGQMEMRRLDSEYGLAYRGLLWLYRAIAMYGESPWRPLLVYWLLAAPLFALGYWWRGDVTYADGLFSALTAGALFRQIPAGIEGWEKLLIYGNMLADIFLLGLTLLALRRRFHR